MGTRLRHLQRLQPKPGVSVRINSIYNLQVLLYLSRKKFTLCVHKMIENQVAVAISVGRTNSQVALATVGKGDFNPGLDPVLSFNFPSAFSNGSVFRPFQCPSPPTIALPAAIEEFLPEQASPARSRTTQNHNFDVIEYSEVRNSGFDNPRRW